MSDIPVCLKSEVYNQWVLPDLTYDAKTLTLARNIVYNSINEKWNEQCQACFLELKYQIPEYVGRLGC